MMMDRSPHEDLLAPVAFTPGVRGNDPLARYWLGQASLRLRRELCWLWRERALQAVPSDGGALPPFADRTLVALDRVRYEGEKRVFFAEDVTARYLSECIAVPPPASGAYARGSFGWLADTLALAPIDCFVLALALLPGVDSASGPVIAACHNDPLRTEPTLALAQRLWDAPDALLGCFDPAHVLLRHGVLLADGRAQSAWQAALAVPPLVARELLFAGGELTPALQVVLATPTPRAMPPALRARIAAVLAGGGGQGMRVLPVLGAEGAPLAEVLAACTEGLGVTLVQPGPGDLRAQLPQLLTTAWLRGHAFHLRGEWLDDPAGHEAGHHTLPLPGLPLAVFVGVHERAAVQRLGAAAPPPLSVAPMGYGERLAAWRRALPSIAHRPLVAELARRFRYEQAAIARVGAELAALDRPPTEDEVFAAARADLDLGTLAQTVEPRFALGELMLPPAQTRQIDEIVIAMNNLTRVHYEWGTAQAWNESGLAALFAGPPGTGKTMCAEALARALKLPLQRIDLSQVVNKYIGETEKNLRKVFDAAEVADVILFFDEADALFGKRTEVRDAHDRYANLEISYLLERMEHFKGLAILATNRKRDLDEAFLRRLRFVVDFPLPGVAERLRIWRGVIPHGVDATALDFEFLASRFALAGGHIRAIVFHACLQCAEEGAPRALTMHAIIRAVQREYEKLERASSLEQFGPYAPLVASERSVR